MNILTAYVVAIAAFGTLVFADDFELSLVQIVSFIIISNFFSL